MNKLVATYRVQLNKNFNFYQLKKVVPYLSKLGISHIYASPIFQAKQASMHGYDVLNHNMINDELGGLDAYKEVAKEATSYGIGWIQDIVPNHAAYSPDNPMIADVMNKGVSSAYRSFFDIDWNHSVARLKGKILAPFLSSSYQDALSKGDLKLGYKDGKGLVIVYKSLEFPVRIKSNHYKLGNLFSNEQLQHNHVDTAAIKQILEQYEDPIQLDRLLSEQIYLLDEWITAFKEINYRRFFDILDLICIRSECIDVFESTHKLAFKMLSQGKFSGLRVDHIDGLHNPEQYLERLRDKAPETYVIVEKILSGEEQLPLTWKVHGTTGYEFLNHSNGIFIDKDKEKQFSKCYSLFSGSQQSFNELLYECKKLIIEQLFSGDIDNLTRLISHTLLKRAYGKELKQKKIRSALVELFASFSVYRTYLHEKNSANKAQVQFRRALLQATQRNEDLYMELEALEKIMEEGKENTESLQVIMRLQQFTSVVMAKGFEDTALYRYNRLLSLNEVGSNPAKFGITPEAFHTFNRKRQALWPLTLNASSTHDTKRGEDARARLNVLSELPDECNSHINTWTRQNEKLKTKLNGNIAPDSNEEFYIYQTLIGSLPYFKEEQSELTERLKIHLSKMLREAKVHSSWINPQIVYEEAVIKFAAQLIGLENQEFLDTFLPFQKKIATYGFINSLAQTLLKITSPGVPDFYQGSELWNFSMGDPDNRRPIDYKIRQQLLEEIIRNEYTKCKDLLNRPEDGKVKLYLIFRALQARQKLKTFFTESEYIPLKAEGPYSKHIVAFCRKRANTYALVVLPRLLASLTEGQVDKLNSINWSNTFVNMPLNAPTVWQNTLEQNYRLEKISENRLSVSELFEAFPVSLLLSGD